MDSVADSAIIFAVVLPNFGVTEVDVGNNRVVVGNVNDGVFSESDRFIAPAGMTLNLDCTGGDIETTAEGQAELQSQEDYYFE